MRRSSQAGSFNSLKRPDTSLLDNWRYQSSMTHSNSLPQLVFQDDVLNFNINEDDLDCPAQDDSGPQRELDTLFRADIAVCGSSEGLYDSSEDDSCSTTSSVCCTEGCDDHSNNNFTFTIWPDSESESETFTPTARTPSSLPQNATFFSIRRRASFDNGIYGIPDRILSGEMTREGLERQALTAPGTPAEPSTPVARYLSQEELLGDHQQIFKKIHSLLCAERVTQMTKTYNDIEAVTHLLEEKERDLELAARIGQTLLSKNKELSTRGDHLDEQLTYVTDKLNQLKHDLAMKDELLKFYCQDLQDESSGDCSPSDGLATLSKINTELLQKKIGTLEEENLTLRLESAQLRSDTESFENKEKQLVEDCLQQLGELNQQVETFAGELRLKTEESSRQKEEITNLLAQVADLHKKVRQLTVENMDLSEKLQAAQEAQRQLTQELTVRQDRYDELFEMLEEAQDELRGHRNRNNPKATRHLYASAALPSALGRTDSLASELQNSLQQEEKDEEEKKTRRAYNWKLFETARAARKAASKASHNSSVIMSTSTSNSQATSNVNSDTESFHSDGYNADMDSIYGSGSELGRPGIPGSNDLESALKRLAMRRANELNERDFHSSLHDSREDRLATFRMSDTPDSVSTPPSGYSYLGFNNSQQASTQFRISDKLQIIKPLEGSVTLRHWQRLAQPHLGGLFEHREGVKVRGERKLDLEGEVYTLSDFEEDEDLVEGPGRRMADSSTVYTFTNSVVSHPAEHRLPPSGSYANLSPLASSTPTCTRRSNTSSTYTMSLGLAAILQGREGSITTGSVMRPIASCPIIPAADNVPITAAESEVGNAASGTGVLGKLISTGYSLLWNKSDASLSSTPSSASSREGTPADGAKSPKKSTANQIFPKGSSSGVLGAIATFRKNGIL